MVYLDNAATTFPKPPEVAQAMAGCVARLGANPGRGGHRLALAAGRLVESCREALAQEVGIDRPEQVIFTSGCTAALNLAITGTLRRGDEVVCTHSEHNAVMRTLERWRARGDITVRVAEPDERGLLTPEGLRRAMTRRTALVIVCHASNVTGVVQDVGPLGRVCEAAGVPLLVDAAQTAGLLDIRLRTLHASMVALPGHKGLLGPQGIGALVLGDGMAPEPLLYGGTGSASEQLTQPALLPDRYESGTLNLPGIAGLLAGLRFVQAHRAELRDYEQALTQRLLSRLAEVPAVRVLGQTQAARVGVVSFVAPGDLSYLADALDRCGFCVRGGLHCAPMMHRWLGTLQTGAIRASVGPFTTERDMDDFAAVVQRLTRRG